MSLGDQAEQEFEEIKEAFPALQFKVEGIPKDLDGAKGLAARDKYHFQW